jgi:hypothetical protein
MTPKSLCDGMARALEPFVSEVFNYKFSETPNYSKLKHLLASFLMAHQICPDDVFDWSKFVKKKPFLANYI